MSCVGAPISRSCPHSQLANTLHPPLLRDLESRPAVGWWMWMGNAGHVDPVHIIAAPMRLPAVGSADSSRRAEACAIPRAALSAAHNERMLLQPLKLSWRSFASYLSEVVLFSDLSTVLSHFRAALHKGHGTRQPASPWEFWTTVNAQRKFVDLINEATFKWANWDPSKVIQKSAELKVEGNIFTHPEMRHIAQDYPAFVAPETDIYQIHSQPVRRLDIQADVGACRSQKPMAIQHQTRSDLIHKPRLLCVADGFDKFDLPMLKRKVVVEEVHNCPGFQRADLSFLAREP
ncbi:hypothetical protein EDB85DRAFT_2150197 [Lactarius pseudohatsudake]|nr:hypothetical protein EDB85DRAFT_2150197 [Lactarius pseudohatsudake]